MTAPCGGRAMERAWWATLQQAVLGAAAAVAATVACSALTLVAGEGTCSRGQWFPCRLLARPSVSQVTSTAPACGARRLNLITGNAVQQRRWGLCDIRVEHPRLWPCQGFGAPISLRMVFLHNCNAYDTVAVGGAHWKNIVTCWAGWLEAANAQVWAPHGTLLLRRGAD